MARRNKAHSFAIYDESGIPSPDPTCHTSSDNAISVQEHRIATSYRFGTSNQGQDAALEVSEFDTIEDGIFNTQAADVDASNGRCSPDPARTSISSLPDSTFETDYEQTNHVYRPSYIAPTIRPSFRRPESVMRMQMSSPAPFERSPRRSVLRHTRSSRSTPRSVRSSLYGSPRTRKAVEEEDEMDRETALYPLILLHVTLLPVELRWSASSMQDLVPAYILENLQLLRAKVSETILERGILIPHPREEYELLEERLLEALELRKERVTKCGHFRNRESTSSTDSSAADSDSGLGSSVENEAEICHTCHNHIKASSSGVGERSKKWNVKVFASNGLLRASSWSAVWSEMERVDVEILPWISEDLRRKLDDRRREEEAQQERIQAEDQARMQRLVEEQLQIARGANTHAEEAKTLMAKQLEIVHSQPEPSTQDTDALVLTRSSGSKHRLGDLPQVYRPKDIPLSVLLKNYIYLLAQDRKTVAFFAVALIAFWLSLSTAVSSGGQHDLEKASSIPLAGHAVPLLNAATNDADIETSSHKTYQSLTQDLADAILSDGLEQIVGTDFIPENDPTTTSPNSGTEGAQTGTSGESGYTQIVMDVEQ